MKTFPITHSVSTRDRLIDRAFKILVQGIGITMIILILLVGIFLLLRAIPAVRDDQENFFTYGGIWNTTHGTDMHFGIATISQITIFISVIALILATPLAIGVAIYLTYYIPPSLGELLAYVIDFLAGIPTIIYGIWGLYILAPLLRFPAEWLNTHLGAVFLFKTGNVSLLGGGTIFTGSLVLSVMILPIMTAIIREVLAQIPHEQIEAALALGAIRWEVVRLVILPFGRFSYISAAMLGLSRACGETIALLIILRASQHPFTWSVFDGGETFTTKIAAAAEEFDNQHNAGAYIAAGLALFLLTLITNALGRAFLSERVHR